jgi:2-iminobutanoate/2-iminopropanoate deaminase
MLYLFLTYYFLFCTFNPSRNKFLLHYLLLEKEDSMNKTMLVIAATLIVVGSIASAQTDPTKRQFVNLPKPVANLPFSDGVLVGNTFYLSGRIGLDPQSGKVPADVGEEVRNLLDGVKKVLGEAGMSMNDLVYVQVFCPDLTLFGKFNEIYRTYFAKDFPARAFVGSGALLFGGHFEFQGIAVR